MKKITISLSGQNFDLKLEEGFAKELEKELPKICDEIYNVNVKSLLHEYIDKCYKLYQIDQSLKNSIEKLSF
jgi:hypothetical protein